MKKARAWRNVKHGKYSKLLIARGRNQEAKKEAEECNAVLHIKKYGIDDYPDPYDAPPRNNLRTWKNRRIRKQYLKNGK